jgi:protein-L-isoaspartate(D-aspartate) O-methyltransferase
VSPEIDLSERRRFYAEEVQATSHLKNAAVVEALAAVPRERFLGPGPWTIRGEADFLQPARQTADADPRHVYHNLAIAIDPARQLFNGAPENPFPPLKRLRRAPHERTASCWLHGLTSCLSVE